MCFAWSFFSTFIYTIKESMQHFEGHFYINDYLKIIILISISVIY